MYRIIKLNPEAELTLTRKAHETGLTDTQYLEAFVSEHLGRHFIESESINFLKSLDVALLLHGKKGKGGAHAT